MNISKNDVLNSYIEELLELHKEGNEYIKELLITGLEELIQTVKETNNKSWDE